MQTFLTHGSDFVSTARILDNKRLGKQRVESLQILKCLSQGDSGGWRHHPAVKMWRGYENSLVLYSLAICDEWLDRGYADSCRDQIFDFYDDSVPSYDPPWLDSYSLLVTHRGRLFIKNRTEYPEWWRYSRLYLKHTCCDGCNYWWPTHSYQGAT